MSPIATTVRDAMDTKLVNVEALTPAIDAIRAMVEKDVWSLLVIKKGKEVGVVTERDFLRRCVIPGLDPRTTTVEKIMSSPLLTIDPQAGLGEALRKMTEKNVRRLYVVEGGNIVGRITQTGLRHKTLEVFLSLTSI